MKRSTLSTIGATTLSLLFFAGCEQNHNDHHDDAGWMQNEGSGTNHHTLQDRSGTGGAAINGDSTGGMSSGKSNMNNGSPSGGTGGASGFSGAAGGTAAPR